MRLLMSLELGCLAYEKIEGILNYNKLLFLYICSK